MSQVARTRAKAKRLDTKRCVRMAGQVERLRLKHLLRKTQAASLPSRPVMQCACMSNPSLLLVFLFVTVKEIHTNLINRKQDEWNFIGQ